MKKIGFDSREDRKREERLASQEERLREMLTKGYQRSPLVKKMMDERDLTPGDFAGPADLEKLPVLSRERVVELEASEPPYGGFCDRRKRIDRIFTSPGPVYEPHLGQRDPLWARAYFAAGIRRGDIVLNAFSYHLVAAGLTFHDGLRRLGATVVPAGTSGTQIQVQLIKDLGVTAYTGTPSFLMSVIRKAEELGHNFQKDFRLRRACFAAEPLDPNLRSIFESQYGIETYQMYGATEVGDIAFECRQRNGWHLCEEVYVEIVDPTTGKRVGPGEYGEIVVTRLNDIFFLFRFGTGDLSRMIETECACGRTSLRLDGIAGRIGDAVKVRGMFVAPSQMKRMAGYFPDLKFQMVVERSAHEDSLTFLLQGPVPSSEREETGRRFREQFRALCSLRIDSLAWVEEGTLREGDKLMVDRRTWK